MEDAVSMVDPCSKHIANLEIVDYGLVIHDDQSS